MSETIEVHVIERVCCERHVEALRDDGRPPQYMYFDGPGHPLDPAQAGAICRVNTKSVAPRRIQLAGGDRWVVMSPAAENQLGWLVDGLAEEITRRKAAERDCSVEAWRAERCRDAMRKLRSASFFRRLKWVFTGVGREAEVDEPDSLSRPCAP